MIICENRAVHFIEFWIFGFGISWVQWTRLNKYFKTVEEDSILEEPNLSRLLIFVFTLLCLSWMVLLYISILFFDLDFKESSNENIIYVYYATLLLSHVILFTLFWKLMSYNVDVIKKEETGEMSMVMENSNHRQTRY